MDSNDDGFTPIEVDFTGSSAAPLPTALVWRPQAPARAEPTPSGLLVVPHGRTDMWRQTHYGFNVMNAPALCARVPSGDFVASTRVRLRPVHKYDQAGLVVYADDDTWLKTSCEFIPGGPHKQGAVVTQGGYSDWSTAPAPLPADAQELALEFRVARLGDALLVHTRAAPDAPFFLARLARLPVDPSAPLAVGLYACCPVEEGGSAVFERLEVRRPREGEVTLH